MRLAQISFNLLAKVLFVRQVFVRDVTLATHARQISFNTLKGPPESCLSAFC